MSAQVLHSHVRVLRPVAALVACLALGSVALAFTAARAIPPQALPAAGSSGMTPAPGAVVLGVAPDRVCCTGPLQDAPLPPRGATPAFTELSLFQDERAGFAFWYADGWRRCDTGQERAGVVMAPQPGEKDTWFSVEPRFARAQLAGEGAVGLDGAFHAVIGALPGFELLWHDAWVAGALTGVEAKFTFQDGQAVRKRWVRLLFEEDRQVAVVAQAASVEDYAYWEPMIVEMMTTLVLGNVYYEAPGLEEETL